MNSEEDDNALRNQSQVQGQGQGQEPAETSEEQSQDEALLSGEAAPDGVWRPEEWRNGRWIVVRNLPTPGSPQVQRQTYGESKFGSSTTIFESEEAAEAQAKALNEEIVQAMLERQEKGTN